ncbi:MAG: hypothetical protein ACOX2R_00575 [Anaerolineae bacterium]
MSQPTRGLLTAPAADALRALVAGRPTWRVYQDHSGLQRQRLWAHLDSEPHRWNGLGGVDILLGDSETGRAILVLEIEETACRPKTLLGDITTLALADYVTTESDDRHYRVTPATELWVAFPTNPRGHQAERNRRMVAKLQAVSSDVLELPRIRLVQADAREALEATLRQALTERFGSA